MLAQGWFRDPSARHDERWFSDGLATGLVRDGAAESSDRVDDARTWSESELAASPAPAPAPIARPDPARRNRRLLALYLLLGAGLVTVVGLHGRADSMAPAEVALAVLVVPTLIWPVVNRVQRRRGDLPYTAVDNAWSPWQALRTGSGNSRYDRPPQLLSQDDPRLVTLPSRVYLFRDNRFLTTVADAGPHPGPTFDVDGVEYASVSVIGPYLELGGRGVGFDVQVARPW